MKRFQVLLGLTLLLILAGSATHFVPKIETFTNVPRGTSSFWDFRLFNNTVHKFQQGEPLYRTDVPEYFEPGSGVYKYPPPYAGLVSLKADPRWRQVARVFLLADTLALLLAIGILWAGRFLRLRFRDETGRVRLRDPSIWLRGAGVLVLGFAWKPFWESLAGIQLEPLILLLIAFALAATAVRRVGDTGFALGAALGMAAALKIYPLLFAPVLLLSRGPVRSVLFFGLGFAVVTLFGILRIGWEETRIYYFEILPHLGGTSLALENLSLPAQLGAALVHDYGPIPHEASSAGRYTLEVLGSPAQLWTVRGIWAAVAGVLGVGSLAVLRSVEPGRRVTVGLMLWIPIVLMLMPTSWLDYQTLLFIPVAWLFLRLPESRRYLPLWLALGAVVAPALCFDTDNPAYVDTTPPWISAIRALVPLGVWAVVAAYVRLKSK